MPSEPLERAPLYHRVAGEELRHAPPVIQKAHLDSAGFEAFGVFSVAHGRNHAARLLARMLGLPRPGEAVNVRVEVAPFGRGQRWERTFGNTRLVSVQYEASPGILAERFGVMEFRFRLTVDGGLVYLQTAAGLRLGPLFVRLPRALAPLVSGREEAALDPDQISVKVNVSLPLLGPLLEYAGRIRILERAS